MKKAAKYIEGASFSSAEVHEEEDDDPSNNNCCTTALVQRIWHWFFSLPIIITYVIIVVHQLNGSFFNNDYPACKGDPKKIGDGRCDLATNNAKCNWDGLDCLDREKWNCWEYLKSFYGINDFDVFGSDNYIKFYEAWEKIGDGKCIRELPYNSYECQFDGGDCWWSNIDCNTPNGSTNDKDSCGLLATNGPHSLKGKNRYSTEILVIFAFCYFGIYNLLFFCTAYLRVKKGINKDSEEVGNIGEEVISNPAGPPDAEDNKQNFEC